MALALPVPTSSDGVPALVASGYSAESPRREVSAGVHFPTLDGYRALAALMVVVTHIAFATGLTAQGLLGHALARFDAGVPLFFVMSGFLLYRPWVRAAFEARTRPDLGRYALRRAARILPLYWIVVAATLLFLPEIQPVAAGEWWIHLLGLQIYRGDGAIEGLTQTWSLCTEIAFYVALPMLGAVALGRRRRDLSSAWRRQVILLTAMVVVAWAFVGVRAWTTLLPDQAGWWLPGYLDWFAAGMLLAVVEVRRRLPSPPRLVRLVDDVGADTATCLVIAVALFAIAVTPVGGAYDFKPTDPWAIVSKHLLYLAAASFLLLPGILHGGRGWTRGLSRGVPHRLGLISYGIFLWHLMLLRMVMPALGIRYFDGRFVLVCVVAIPLAVGAASVTYRLVERPAQVWAHRR